MRRHTDDIATASATSKTQGQKRDKTARCYDETRKQDARTKRRHETQKRDEQTRRHDIY